MYIYGKVLSFPQIFDICNPPAQIGILAFDLILLSETTLGSRT